MKTNGQHEVIARIAGTGLVLATLLALVLASSIAGRAQSSAASPAVPAAAPATPAKASPAAQAGQPTAPAQRQPGGNHEGITVHGHWIIEVRNPDGKLVSHTEFENSLQLGAIFLTNLLSGQALSGGWAISLGPPPGQQNLGETPCYNTITYSNCTIVSPTVAPTTCSSDPSCFATLSVSPTSFQTAPDGALMVTLQGTATAGSGGGVVGTVSTFMVQCGSAVAPANCSTANGNTQGLSGGFYANAFSGRTLDGIGADPSQVTVGSKQTISVTVQFSFQ